MYYKYLLILLYLFAVSSVSSQESIDPYAVEDSLEIDIDIFAEEEPGAITLKYDRKEFRKQRNVDKYLKAELIYHLDDSTADSYHTVRIKARGKNRRETCSFPPIWINIRKSNIENENLKDTKKI
ncbi:hypothetical protein ACFLSP_03105 [Bacteroidota bacterium]